MTNIRSLSNSLLLLLSALLVAPLLSEAQSQPVVWTAQEQPILQQIKTLRQVPDNQRGKTTRDIALEIRQLPASLNKVRLATALAHLSTEGDFGRDTLQEVATTLASALRETPLPDVKGKPAEPYTELAELVRYERVETTIDAPQFTAAVAALDAVDQQREKANFTLTDIRGQQWTLNALKGKVVLVNFWATWCPPCQKEMPDLEALAKKYKDQGFVVLAITDEDAAKVNPFIAARKITYPILLDPGRAVAKSLDVNGLPKSFVYNREGKLVAQSMDMRTRRQFEEMLEQAGLN